MKTIQELAKEAIDIQGAVNLSGVLHSSARIVSELREIANSEGWCGTDAINTHPISVLLSSKIASLTGSECGEQFSKAYNWACDKTSK